MTVNAIKELVDQGKFQAAIDQLAQWEADGIFDTFSEQEQIECLYYQSYALHQGLGQQQEALQIILTARQKYTTPIDRSLLLALLTQQIYTLCNMNRLDEAREVITEGDAILASLTAKDRETGAYWIAFFEERKGHYYCTKNDFDTALEFWQRVLALRKKIGDLNALSHSLHNMGGLYRYKDELDTALDYYQQALDIAKQIGNSHGIADALTQIGWVYIGKGEIDTALTCYQQALTIYEKSSIPFRIAFALGLIVNVYILKGELEAALENCHRWLRLSQEVYQKTENAVNLARCYYRFAWIHYLKGELDTALDYVQQSLAFQGTIGGPYFFFDFIFLSVLIYQAQGEWGTALERLQQLLSEVEQWNDTSTAEVLFELVRVVLAQKNRLQAQGYLSRLQQLQTRTPNPWIHLCSRLAEALVLKQSSRVREKFQAQTILEQIVQEEVLRFDLTALALIQLCDLLIAEVKFSGEPDVWEEVKALVDKLYVMAQDQHSVTLMCEALLLRAKSAVADGKLSQAQSCYEQARLTATEKNLPVLLAKVDTEQKRFEADFEKMQNLIQSNASLQERVTNARMEDYLKKIQPLLKMDMSRES
ncbi:MAG: tetratricopeptide repeat protein [Candidatus Hodarchaeota archaeon]